MVSEAASLSIYLISPYNFAGNGGVNRILQQRARELERRGHSVVMGGPYHSGRSSDVSLDGNFLNTGDTVMRQINTGGAIGDVCFFSWRWFSLIPEIKKKADVVHIDEPSVPGFFLPYVTFEGLFRFKRPGLVATFHASGEDDKKRKMWSRALHRGGFKRAAANKLDKRIAVSHAAKEYNEERFSPHWNSRRVQEYEVIPNPINLEEFTPSGEKLALPNDRLNILFVGRQEKRKGFLHLAQALKIIADDPAYRKKVHLYIAGSQDIEHTANQVLALVPNELYSNVGKISDDLLRQFYRSVDLSVSPAESHESFGLVVGEAMASGIPVVVSAIPGYANVAAGDAGLSLEEALQRFTPTSSGMWQSQGGLVVEPKRPDLLANAIRVLADNQPLRNQLGCHGRLLVENNFSLSGVTDRYEAIYREIAQR